MFQRRGISLNKNALNTNLSPSPPKLKSVANNANGENLIKGGLGILNAAPSGGLKPLCDAKVVATDENLIDLDFSNQNHKQADLKKDLKPTKESHQLQLQQLFLPQLPQPQHPQQQQQQQLPPQQPKQALQQQQQPRVSRIPRLSLKPSQTLNSNQLKAGPLKSRTNLPALTETKPDEEAEEDDEKDCTDEDIEDIDKSTSRDATFLVTDVAKDIYEYMRLLEEQQAIGQNYLKDKKIFTPKVRQRLVNWCIDIHSQLKLLSETTYLTIALIDRYFERVPVKHQSQVQLIAICATLIASKYEEIYPPDIGDLLYLTQNAYSKRDVTRTEIEMLVQLDYNLGRPVPLAFLRRFSKAAHCDLKMHSIAKFLMEISLTEYECCHWRPSLLAAAALFVTVHLVHQDSNNSTNLSLNGSGSTQTRRLTRSQPQQPDRWTKTLVHYSHYSRRQLQEPASTLCKILKRVLKCPSSYNCVKKNFASLTRWPELKSPRVDDLIKLAEQKSRSS